MANRGRRLQQQQQQQQLELAVASCLDRGLTLLFSTGEADQTPLSLSSPCLHTQFNVRTSHAIHERIVIFALASIRLSKHVQRRRRGRRSA